MGLLWKLRTLANSLHFVSSSFGANGFLGRTPLLLCRKHFSSSSPRDAISVRHLTWPSGQVCDRAWSSSCQTLTNKEKIFRLYLVPFFHSKSITAIGTREVDAFKAEMRKREHSIKYINNMLAVLRKMMNQALDWGDLIKVPKIRDIKNHESEEEPPFLTQAEAQAILENMSGTEAAMAKFALNTGLRIGELRALHWSDIDMKQRKMTVRRNIWKGHIGKTKGKRARTVDLNESALEALHTVTRIVTSSFVFCHPDGKPFAHNQGYSQLRTAAKRAGIALSNHGQIGWHTFRHSFASHLVMAGVNLAAVQQLLGHADIKMTMKYAHLEPATLKAAVSVLDDVTRQCASTRQ